MRVKWGAKAKGRLIVQRRPKARGGWVTISRPTLRRNTLGVRVTLPKGVSCIRVRPPRAPGYVPGVSRIVRIVR